MTTEKKVFCQVLMDEKANNNLEKFKGRLKAKGYKASKAEIINILLSKMTMADFDRVTKTLVDSKAEKAKARIIELYRTSNMTEEDLQEALDAFDRNNSEPDNS
ncbi:hypothetical protein [Serratia quinivorans]